MISGSTAFNTNLSASGTDAARVLAAEINTNTSVHGAVATAFNELTSAKKLLFHSQQFFP